MKIRLYFDEDSARHSLARELRVRGADVVTAVELGTCGQTDAQQLTWATNNARVLYSFNRGDFYGLHTVWLSSDRSHAGMVLSRQDLPVGEQMRRLLRLIHHLSAEEMRDRVEFLTAWS